MNNASLSIYRFALMLSFFTMALSVTAQHDPYEVLFNGTLAGELDMAAGESGIYTSEELFLSPLSGVRSLFSRLSREAYTPVRYSRGGLNSRFASVTLFGLDISGNLNTAADYNLWSSLRRSKLMEIQESDAVDFSGHSLIAARTSYCFNAVSVSDRTSVGMFTTDRKGRMGIKASMSGNIGGRWSYMFDIYRKWGRDATVKGVFTDRLAYSASVSGLFGKHRVTLFSAGDQSEDGLRAYTTGEVIDLAGSNYYNPLWGLHNGKVRNSRVAKGFVPVTVVSYEGGLGDKITLSASAGCRIGERTVSGLSWLDAATPYPDYYRYMPSYSFSNLAEEVLREKWNSGDPAVMQVDWGNMYGVNSRDRQTSVYTLSDRVERTEELQGYLALVIRPDDRTTVRVSLRGGRDDVRRSRRMKDLMGGLPTEDIDQYLYEDELYGDKILNNVREPNRKVNVGDIYGYDYDLFARHLEGAASVGYRSGGVEINATVGYGFTSFVRNGRFEKEIYPGDLSYGRSDKISYETYFAEAGLRYAFDAKHSVTGYGYAGRLPQQWAVHYITPMYSNELTGVDKPVTTIAVNAGYSFRGRDFTASFSFYNTDVRDVAETYGYWDDISSTYSTMLLENIGELSRGIELAVDYDFHPRWNVSGMMALGTYKYSNDPDATIYSENTLAAYVSGAVSYLKGYHTAVSPETYFTGRVKYSAGGFSGAITVNYAGGRYVAPSPLRRMQRAYNLAGSDEGLADFVSQEKLGDAFTVDLSLMKSFRMREKYLTLFLSASNLLDNRNIVYGAYEQLRIARRGSGINAKWTPFATKYLYAYGRSYYLSLTFTF